MQNAAINLSVAEFQWCHLYATWFALQGRWGLWALGGIGALQGLLPEEFKFFDVKDFREMQILPVQTSPD